MFILVRVMCTCQILRMEITDVPLSPLALELLRDLPRNIRSDQKVFHYTLRR